AAPTTTLAHTTTTATTSTTLPGGCDAVPTFTSIDCRLDRLIAELQASSDLGRLQKGLGKAATPARPKKIAAEQIGSGEKARKQLKGGGRARKSFLHNHPSPAGRKIIPPPTLQSLTDEATPIENDLQALLAELS